jgi:CheY-like chemotaxis protein
MPRVLVIDDQETVRSMISIVLERKGYEVVAVDSGAAGLRELAAAHFDSAVVDIYMPGIDGTKIIKLLRERAPHLPIVAISGVLLTQSGRTALDLFAMTPGLQDIVCLQKPFDSAGLVQSITQAVKAASYDEAGPWRAS